MAWTKKGKMKEQRKKQQAYLNRYEERIYSGDKTVPTYAQYLQDGWNQDKYNTGATSAVQRGLRKAGAKMKTDQQRRKK